MTTAYKLLMFPALLALSILMALACGPANESVQREIGNLPAAQPQDSPDPTTEPSPEPTVVPTTNNYPNLDETLQNIVQQYEGKAKTATEAAALAPEHSGNIVLSQAEVSAANIQAVNTWMNTQGITVRYLFDAYSYIYAYVPVSILGALSTQTGIVEVTALENHLGINVTVELLAPPSSTVARDADGNELPQLPAWLKGYPHPRSYPKLDLILGQIVGSIESGNGVPAWVTTEEGIFCRVEGQTIGVGVYVSTTGTHATDLITWLRSKSVTVANADMHPDNDYGQKAVGVPLPFTLLKETGDRPGVESVELYGCPIELNYQLFGERDERGSFNLGSTDTQGRTAHGAGLGRV